MKNKLFVICVVGAALIGSTKLSIARGFGGSHGGGFGGGGFGGGGFRGGGGFGGGGFAGGGFHGYGGGMGGGEIHAYSGGMGGGGFQRYGGGMGASQFNSYGGGLAASAYRGGGLGSFDSGLNAMRSNSSGAAMRSGSAGQFANSMANLPDSFREVSTALPTDMGMHSGASAASGYSGNASGLAARESNLSDAEISNSFAALGDSIASTERAATASVDAGERPQGVAAQQASGARNGTFAANAAQNGVRSPGNVAAQATRANTLAQAGDITRHLSPADLHVLGNKIRYDYVNPNDSAWYNAWGGVVLAAAQGAYSPWAPASWSGVNNWFGTNSPAISYDYGDELTYNNGNVVLNGQPIATAQQYWQAATNLVAQGQQAPPKGTQWLPLGMFAAIRGDEKNTNMLFELAVDKKGTVRGNYFNTSDKNSQPIAGAADKKTQRISWVVEDRKDIVFDTGLYNLTKDETVALVHFGKDKTEQWTFVRLKKNNKK